MERSAQSSRELPTEINTENTALMNFDNKLKCLPSYLIELLKETGYYSESSLLSINKKDIKGIENFAREHLHLLVDKKYYIKYYGPLFFKKPEIFQILGGFKKRILELSQQLQKETEAETPNDGGGDGTNNRPINGEPELACIVQDQEMEEDKARSEATFRYTVKNVSKMKDSQLSPACYVRNLSWKIEVIPWSSQTQKRQLQRFLGLFLQCNVESESTSWSCYAVAELRLLSFKEGIEPFSRKIKHLFCSKENDWGFSHFMTLQDILDPDKGFIKDDSITFEVHVEADVPNGVSSDLKNT